MVVSNNTLDFKSSVPYYSQLKKILLDQINQGIWRVGDELPSHSDLCEQYKVSKPVVRQALKELEQEGKIVQRRGKLACIARPKISGHMMEKLSGSYQDITESGFYPINKILKNHVIQADEEIARRLSIDIGTETIEIVRLRFVGDEPFELISSFLPFILCPVIIDIDLTDKSLLAVLEKECGIVMASSRRSIEAMIAGEYEAKLLQVKKGSPLLLINSISYNANGKTMGTTRAIFRGDRARFDVDLGEFHKKT